MDGLHPSSLAFNASCELWGQQVAELDLEMPRFLSQFIRLHVGLCCTRWAHLNKYLNSFLGAGCVSVFCVFSFLCSYKHSWNIPDTSSVKQGVNLHSNEQNIECNANCCQNVCVFTLINNVVVDILLLNVCLSTYLKFSSLRQQKRWKCCCV